MSLLFLRISQSPTGAELLEWFVVDNHTTIRNSGRGTFEDLGQLLAGKGDWIGDSADIVVILPGQSTLLVRCRVPGRSAAQIRKALPFVMEEFLATDIDQVHIAHDVIQRGKSITCAAIEKSQLEHWRARLEQIGLVPGTLVPETLLIKPHQSDTIEILFDEDRALLASEDQFSALETDLIPTALTSLVQVAPETSESESQSRPAIAQETLLTIELINGELTTLQRSELESLSHRRLEWHTVKLEKGIAEWLLQRWLDDPPALNLLQGDYAPPTRQNQHWERWRSVLPLLFAWLAILLAAQGAKGLWADYQADKLSQRSVELYRQLFPQDRKVSAATVKRQMQAHLGQASASESGFLALLGQLAPTLAAQSAQLRSLSYNESRGELSAEVSVSGFEQLDTLEQALKRDSGLRVEISSAEQGQNGVTARLRVKEAA